MLERAHGMILPSGRSVCWAVLLAAGQAATLALVNAGPLVGYQHYPAPWELVAQAPSWALLAFALEVVAVVAGMYGHRRFVGRIVRQAGIWRMTILIAVFVLTSATLSRDLSRYAAELAFASLVQLVHLGAVSLFALSLSDSALDTLAGAVTRVFGPESDAAEPGGLDRFAWLLAGFVAIVAAVLALVAYDRHPHIPDEVAYVIQARYLAAGRLTMPLPPVATAFDVDLMLYQADRWFSSVPPGWPFILAVGAFLRLPWLVNPLLGGLNILLSYVLLREIYSRRAARIALLLLAASPWALFMAMNFMTHTATLTAALVAAVAVARMQRDPALRWAILGGVGIGIVGVIRPLDGLAVAMVLGIWSLGARGARARFGPTALLTSVAALTGALVLPYNWYLMGSARTFPVMAYFDRAYGPGTNALGFGANRGMKWSGLDPLPGHGPLDVLINANFNLFQLNTELLGWSIGSLILLALFVGCGPLRRADRIMLGVIGVVAGMQSVYWFSGGPDFGARYWFLIIVPCLALAARGVDAFGALVSEAARYRGAARLYAGVGALLAVTVVIFIPWRAADKYYHYRGMRPDARTLASNPALRNGMVLVRGQRHPDFSSAVVYNPLDVSSPDPLFVWDRGDDVRRALVEAYPARRFWVVDGPTVTGEGYRMLAGPLTGRELLDRHDGPVGSPAPVRAPDIP